MVIVVGLFAAITTLDLFTSASLNIAVTYFLPTVLAAWALGRSEALLCAFVAAVPYYLDQIELMDRGHQSLYIVVINILVRLLTYIFVAEVTYRLVKSQEKTKADADSLARLNKDLKQTYVHLDEDLNAAGLLQKTAMSVEPVEVPGCSTGVVVRYAGRIGGDYADTGVMDGRVYACVADISGKGTPAALFTTLLKYLITEAIEYGQHGGEMIESISSSLRAMMPVDMFVTLFYAELDRITGLLECINAGHPEAYVCRARTGNLEPIKYNAPVLGSIDIPEGIKVTRLMLEESDTLVIYSDGATDSKALDGSRLGNEPIKEIIPRHVHLSPQDMAKAVVSDIVSISQPNGMDDLSVVCMRYTGEVLHLD